MVHFSINLVQFHIMVTILLFWHHFDNLINHTPTSTPKIKTTKIEIRRKKNYLIEVWWEEEEETNTLSPQLALYSHQIRTGPGIDSAD